MTEYKTCTKCGQSLPLEKFSLHNGKKSSQSGRRSTCKSCDAEYNRDYRARNREKVNQRKREWNKKNRHKIVEWDRRYREANRERLREYHRQWHEENKDHAKAKAKEWLEKNSDYKKQKDKEYGKANRDKNNLAAKKYRQRNPDKVKTFQRNWSLNHPENSRLKAAKRRALKKENGVFQVTKKDIARMLKKPCVYCGAPSEHIDHVVPIIKGGRHSIGNMAPACAFCNVSKGAKLVSEWKAWKKNANSENFS